MCAVKEKKVCVEINVDTLELINEIGQKYSLNVKERFDLVLTKGVDAIRNEEEGISIEDLTKSMKNIESKIGEIHKSSGQAAQAGLGLMTYFAYMAPFIFDSSIESLNERNTKDSAWFDYMQHETKTSERFNIWWNAGGGMRRNPNGKRIANSLRDTLNVVDKNSEHTTKKLFGFSAETWDRITREKNDDMKKKKG